MKTKSKFLAFLTFLAIFMISSSYAAQMEDYCVIPPYVKRDVSVNIMILVDNSHDMLGYAYVGDGDGDTSESDDDFYCRNYAADSCFDLANNKYTKEYYGYFDPRGCYTPGTKFKKVGTVNFSVAGQEITGCPSGQFNGNILNWATMSRLSIAKKVIVGGRYSVPLFYLEGDASRMPPRQSEGCTWTITTVGENLKDLKVSQPGATPCPWPIATWGAYNIDRTDESTEGILQEFTDVNPKDLNFDKGSPRFGIAKFTTTGVTYSTISWKSTYENFLNEVRNMGTKANNDLATAHAVIIGYFDNEGLTNDKDPYKSCASWESPCIEGVAVPCRKSFILMVTSGTDVGGTPYPSGTSCTNPDGTCLKGNAAYAYNNDLRTAADMPGTQNLSTYVVHTFGSTTNQAILQNTAAQGGGNYYSAGTDDLADVLRQALQDIIKRAAAGTAASVLASGEGQGANLIQAVFYPRKKFYNSGTGVYDEIAWIGRLTNFWYYVDPFFVCSNIREDTVKESPYSKLNLIDDYITQLYFDTSTETTKARRWQSDSKGCISGSKLEPDIELERLGNLWEAGVELWKRTSARSIKTTIGGSLIDFSTTNASTLRPYLDPGDINGDAVVNDADATRLIEYIHGQDFSNLRSRTVAVDLNGDGDTLDAGEGAKVWKLGDVLNSTPKISSWIPLNTYHKVYSDTTYGNDTTSPPSGFINTSTYMDRGMVFAGANDGMLHAFKLGSLNLPDHNKASPTCTFGSKDMACLSGTELGKEVWAFIPKNALPYLKYLTDPGYCHVYTVDLTPYIFDASINGNPDVDRTVNSWRTILIGGMRLGGACKDSIDSCTVDLNGDGVIDNKDCVKTPVSGNGFSSYFALDVTNQNNPILLWEFSDPELGFTTTGPAVVRIGDKTKNGNWFVVFGSGPTGPTTGSGSTDYQFLGRSDQELKLFVIGPLSATPGLPTVTPISTGIPNAFAGSMLNSTHDVDLDYQDDAIYIPYVKKDTAAGTWTQGGVGRLLTKEDISPSNWAWSKVIDDIGPVTSSVVKLQNNKTHTLWLFFGTGRYYFEQAATVDDQDGQRRLFGITEPCFQNGAFSTGCTSSRTIGQLTQVDLTSASGVSDPEGWYINLDTSSGSYRAERVITDPMATSSGLVFFTTYKPYIDVCSFGGKSFIWALRYNTGGCASASLKGVALLQVSTGSIEQVNLSTAFTEKGGRRTSAMEGVPPTAQGLSLLSQPPPVKRTIHMRER